MAKKYDIDIDSYIGGWEINKKSVKMLLEKAGDNEIMVRVNSLGGDVDTAIAIASQFEAQGNVICDLYSFNASAATVLTLGAKKVRIHENAMYLIHKAMVWVEEFGNMNEDDIDALIDKLKSMQQNSAVVTLNIAKMYAKKTGKNIHEILNLMKEQRWLNADEAKQWGFVDEIFSGSNQSKKIVDMVEMLNCAELPIPVNMKIGEIKQTEEFTEKKDFVDAIIEGIKNFFTQNKTEMNKKIITADKISALLNIKELEAVDDKVEFTTEQISMLENMLSEREAEIEKLKNGLSGKLTEIENLTTEVENLKKAPGDKTKDVTKTSDIIDDEKEGIFENDFVESAKKLFYSLP